MNRLLERFLRYVKIDTESVPDVQRYPSSEKQKNLLALLRDELVQMGISATMDEKYGYVYATIPKTSRATTSWDSSPTLTHPAPSAERTSNPLLQPTTTDRTLRLPRAEGFLLRSLAVCSNT